MIDYSDRKGDWIGTYSGLRFYPQDPRPEDISIVDIAAALVRIPRFGGHTHARYSVAEHSLSCADRAPDECKFDALMHDASEAYLMDLPRPIKRMLPEYEAMERRIQAVVARKFGFTDPMPAIVKAIDNEVLVAEATLMMEPPADGSAPWWTDTTQWPDLNKIKRVHLQLRMSEGEAFKDFMWQWLRLSVERNGHVFTANNAPGFNEMFRERV